MSFAEIKKAINSNLAKPLNTLISELFTNTDSKIDTVNTNVTNTKTVATNAYNVLTNSTYGNNAIRTLLNTVNTNLTGGKVPVVKKVQRGIVPANTAKTGYTGSYYYVDVKISAVDTTKSFILSNFAGDGNTRSNPAFLYDSTTVRIITYISTSENINPPYTSTSGMIPWQVIEFY